MMLQGQWQDLKTDLQLRSCQKNPKHYMHIVMGTPLTWQFVTL